MYQTRRGNWLVGCGVVLAVFVLLLVGLGIYVAMNIRGWTATGLDKTMTAMIEQAPIDDTEKAETIAVVQDLVQDFRDGDVTVAQLMTVVEEITESPLLPAAGAMGVGQAYFKDSGLTQEEQADGRVQFARIAHGLADGHLDEADLIDVLQPIKAKANEPNAFVINLPNGQSPRIKNPDAVDDAERRAFVEAARAKADDKGLPATPPPFDLSGELERVIGIAMGTIERSVEEDAAPDQDHGHEDHSDHEHDPAPEPAEVP